MGKGKAPAFQFYVRDWLSDPELRSASLLSRGAWIDCLCFMWENSQRGELTRTPLKFSRLISGSLDEALHFLNEIYDYEFGDIEIEDGVTFPLTLENCNTKVTIRNRRMYSDYKDKQNTRLRVRKHREKKSVTPKKQECNGDVTLTSSSSSSSSTTKIKKGTKKFTPPSENEVIKYFTENGYLASAGKKAFKYYDAGEWIDARGNQVKGWKQKMIANWFSDENKNMSQPNTTKTRKTCQAGPCQTNTDKKYCDSCQTVINEAGCKTYAEWMKQGHGEIIKELLGRVGK